MDFVKNYCVFITKIFLFCEYSFFSIKTAVIRLIFSENALKL